MFNSILEKEITIKKHIMKLLRKENYNRKAVKVLDLIPI